jgi:putative ATPase
MDLFEDEAREARARTAPLADRMRPDRLEDVEGQAHLVGEGGVLRRAIEAGEPFSMILWGPPGVGKTTLARIIARTTGSAFRELSAVAAGVADVRAVIAEAERGRARGIRTVLFLDEIHRFNKAQQDALLHSVEEGALILIGATTENPSFEVIGPLLSRSRICMLQPLGPDAIRRILGRALQDDDLLRDRGVTCEEDALELLSELCGGDARVALNALELAVRLARPSGAGDRVVDAALVTQALQRRAPRYDRRGEQHYDTISAFIKSVRGSDPDAALHWLARMIEAGEDPKFIARRLIVLASEDVGNADPRALVIATAAFTAVNAIGMPEGRLVLAQATTYLAAAPKSNASYRAIEAAQEDVRSGPLPPVPLHLRNAPTGRMKADGWGKGYRYPHDFDDAFVEQDYLPEELRGRTYYRPTGRGHEARLREHLARLRKDRDRGDG